MEEIESKPRIPDLGESAITSPLEAVFTVDSNGIVQSASDSVERMFGWKPLELIGQRISLLISEPCLAKHDERLAELTERNVRNTLNRSCEVDAQRKDGGAFAVEFSWSRMETPACDEPLFVGVFRDLTGHRRIEKELRLLQSIVLAIAEATDLNSAMVTALEHICTATRWDYGEAWLPDETGERLSDKPVWYARHGSRERFEDMARGATFCYGEGLPGRVWASKMPEWLDDLTDKQVFFRSDQAHHAGLNAGVAFPILAENQVVAVLAFFSRERRPEDRRLIDIVSAALAVLGPVVKRRQIEDELARYRQQLEELVSARTQALETSLAQLRQADRLASIGTLAAGLGHDMNNVLLPVRARLEILEEERMPKPNEFLDQIRMIRVSIDYLQQLADGLHLLTRDPDDIDEARDWTNLGRWWKQVEPLLSCGLPKNTVFEANCFGDLPDVAVARHRLTQAVLNMIVNAGEAIEDGGHVCVRAESLADGDFVRLCVSDDGLGMTDEVRHRAFDPFFTTKRRGLGTGLGLSLVHGVAQSVGGHVEIDSQPRQGTTVSLILPVAHRSESGEPTVHPAYTALVSVCDQRIATLVAVMLRSLDVEVRLDPGTDLESTSIWVIDQTTADPDRVEVFLRKRNCRLVVLENAPQAWMDLGAVVLQEPEDFRMLRETLNHVVRSLAEAGS